MDPIRWLRLLRGTVFFRASGGFPERFLNLCNVRGIHLIAPQKNGDDLTAGVCAPDYARLRLAARAAGMVLHAETKAGFPFFLRRHRARLGLPIAAAAFLLLAWLLSGFVWSVDVQGGTSVSKEQVLHVMASLGLRAGARRGALDSAALSLGGMHALSGKVSWIGIQFSGMRAVVEVHDYVPPDEDETFKDPCNLVADFDGLLLSVQAENGKSVALPGSGVKAGDLLISGITQDRYGAAHFYEARGTVTAMHERSLRVSMPRAPVFGRYREVRRVCYLRLFSLWIPLGFFPRSGSYDAFQTDAFCSLGGVALPLGITTRTRAYFGDAEPTNGFLLLCDDLTRNAFDSFGNTRLLSVEYSLLENSAEQTLIQTSRCIDFMGKQEKIEVQTG